MKDLVGLENTTEAAIYLPAMPGYALGFILAPGSTDIPAEYWDTLCKERAHTMRLFIGKDIKVTGRAGTASAFIPEPPVPTRAAPPVQQAAMGPMPGVLEGLSREECAALIEGCQDLNQLKAWGQAETREAITDMLLARWKVLGGSVAKAKS